MHLHTQKHTRNTRTHAHACAHAYRTSLPGDEVYTAIRICCAPPSLPPGLCRPQRLPLCQPMRCQPLRPPPAAGGGTQEVCSWTGALSLKRSGAAFQHMTRMHCLQLHSQIKNQVQSQVHVGITHECVHTLHPSPKAQQGPLRVWRKGVLCTSEG